MLITGVLIPADEDVPIRRVDLERGDIDVMQKYVGGLFEAIDLQEPSGTLWCHEEALLIQSPVNRRASLILWMHHKVHRGHTAIRGDVLITGQPDEEGDSTSIPMELLRMLFFHNEYKAEFKVIGEDGWKGNQARYVDWSEAYNAAIRTYLSWALAEDMRVIPTSPLN